ncbi:MAG: bifunctional heptose 7-phosphate kinase/heptose 1-phosphate adenyltransferase [Thermoanaerobaculia bacterium]
MPPAVPARPDMSFPVTRDRLLALVNSFAGRPVVVAGDYVLDRFIYGYPKRISREAPVLILRYWKEESLPGSAGNTAANIRSLGGDPRPVGVIGDDTGAALRDILRSRGIDTSGLLDVRDYRTPTKTRILGGGPSSIKQQIVRFDREQTLEADTRTLKSLLQKLHRSADGASGAVLSDYGYGSVSPAAVGPLREELSRGAPILVDSRHRLPEYRGVDAATPNEEELEEAVGERLGDSGARLEAAGSRLRTQIGCRTLLVTRGSRGMVLFADEGPPTQIPVHGTDQVADVTGAGDTVIAAFGLSLAAGASPLEAALLANFAGGVVVMKMGTATLTANELREAIHSDHALLS